MSIKKISVKGSYVVKPPLPYPDIKNDIMKDGVGETDRCNGYIDMIPVMAIQNIPTYK